MGSARATTTIILLAGLGLTGCAGEQELPASAPLTAEADEPDEPVQGAPLPADTPDTAVAPTEAPTPAATFEGITGAYFVEYPGNIGSGCVLTPAQVQQVLAAWVPDGEVSLDEEYSTNGGQCTYRIGENTIAEGGTYSMSDNTALLSFRWTRYPYEDGVGFTSSSATGEVTVGGTTPQTVLDSAFAAFRDVKVAGDTSGPPQLRPEVGNGLVLDGGGARFILAADDYWYEASFSGAAVGYDPALAEDLVSMASVIYENE